jgi:hypothetical protein
MGDNHTSVPSLRLPPERRAAEVVHRRPESLYPRTILIPSRSGLIDGVNFWSDPIDEGTNGEKHGRIGSGVRANNVQRRRRVKGKRKMKRYLRYRF